MVKKECPSCAMSVDDASRVCPICGYEFPVANKGFVVVAIILLVVTIMYLIF